MNDIFKSNNELPRFAAHPTLRSPVQNGENFSSPRVLVIDAGVGYWREVPREGRRGFTQPAAPRVLGWLILKGKKDRLIEAVRWDELETWLSKYGGFEYVDERPPF